MVLPLVVGGALGLLAARNAGPRFGNDAAGHLRRGIAEGALGLGNGVAHAGAVLGGGIEKHGLHIQGGLNGVARALPYLADALPFGSEYFRQLVFRFDAAC